MNDIHDYEFIIQINEIKRLAIELHVQQNVLNRLAHPHITSDQTHANKTLL